MPGNKTLTGWGVRVRIPGQKQWSLLTIPGDYAPLSTTLAGALAWQEDYQRRGCETKLVEVPRARGRTYRPRVKPDELECKTGKLFG